MMKIDYQAYLASEHWQNMRRVALERAGNKCQLCGYGWNLNVHHNCYDRLGNELPTDLCVLCRPCHERFHGVAKKPEKTSSKQHKGFSFKITVNPGVLVDGHLFAALHAGISYSAIRKIGIPTPPNKGWLKKLRGKTISHEAYDQIMQELEKKSASNKKLGRLLQQHIYHRSKA